MKRLRLLAFDPSGVIERTYSRFPVRVGRHPENDLQIIDPRISRFHAQFRIEADALVLCDVSSQNGTVVAVGPFAEAQVVRGADVRAADGRLTVLVGGVRLEATLENGDATDLPYAFAPAARDAAQATTSACELYQERFQGGIDAIRPVLDALLDGLLMMRLGIHADETRAAGDRDGAGARKETRTALLEWTHASTVGMRLVQQSIELARIREACLLSEATEAIDSLLGDLDPEKLESETNDVCAEWPAARATAVFARYRTVHRRLSDLHAQQPSALLGAAFAGVRAWAVADVCVTQKTNEANAATPALKVSQGGAVPGSEALQTTKSDAEEHPPSSEG